MALYEQIEVVFPDGSIRDVMMPVPSVPVNLSEREIREVALEVFREREDEVRAQVEDVPRTTLSALLGLDLTQDTPTWDAIFQAVDDLWEAHYG